MLPEALRRKLFPLHRNAPPATIIDIAKQHLTQHNIPFSQQRPPLPDLPDSATTVDEFIPDLVGADLAEHFYKLGVYAGRPWIELAWEACRTMAIPPIPIQFNTEPGWTFYPPMNTSNTGWLHLGDEPPADNILVFDSESSWSLSKYPLFAVALGPSGWYSWTSPAIAKQSDCDHKLIPFGERNEAAQLVIGHNVSFDRIYIHDEYRLPIGQRRFIDTMSLHCAIAGLSSQQRPEWNRQKTNPDVTCDEHIEDEPVGNHQRWTEHSAMNNLADAVKLHCGVTVDKSDVQLLIDATWPSLQENHQRILQYCARDVKATADLFQALWPKYTAKCPHPVSQAGMLMMGSMILPVDQSWPAYIERCEAAFQESVREGELLLSRLAEEMAMTETATATSDPWLSQLDWTPIPEKYSKKQGKPIGDVRLFNKPAWFKKYWQGKLGRCHVTIRSSITPLLLKMTWHGRPVHLSDEHGWCYMVPVAEKDAELQQAQRRYIGDTATHALFKVPHLTEDTANVGSLLAKGYQKAIEKGVLSSFDKPEVLSQLLSMNAKWSFWTGYRERLSRQLAVYPDRRDHGFIIPGTVVMGTVTRRAVENAWMTAGNPKKQSAGSEQKAMVRAPPGWSFVGADVDSQELWIASLLGDAGFGEHGATAMGWMTLQGSRQDATDLHSRTAQILGMRRDDAKIFTYGRIYGAGQKYAASLLSRFNPAMAGEEARQKAADLYAKTKGRKAGKGGLYVGGSESFMFNQLEAIAGQPAASTPVLNCRISDALSTVNVGEDYMTSRVNWAVQSSAVDYLHLMLVAMNYLAKLYRIQLRLSITIHDELRFLVRDGEEERAAMALQVSNLWVRAMFAHQLGFHDLPFSVAFFSLVDIDRVLRKEPTADCITPTNPTAIPPGRSLNIYDLWRQLQVRGGMGAVDEHVLETVRRVKSTPRPLSVFKPHPRDLKQWEQLLRRQIDGADPPATATGRTIIKTRVDNIQANQQQQQHNSSPRNMLSAAIKNEFAHELLSVP